MATIRSFEEMELWRRARSFAKKVYEQTVQGTFVKDFSLRGQISDSSGSIMDNIAEGFGRGGNREFINFLSYARGSADECRSQLYRAFDRGHIKQESFANLKNEAIEISKMITGFINYLQKSRIRGSKFMEPIEVYNIISPES